MASSNKHSKKLDAGGLNPRERAFVKATRDDPAAPGWKRAQLAGYEGDPETLKKRASQISKKPAVLAAIHAAARDPEEIELPDDATLKTEIRKNWRSIMRSPYASALTKVQAGKELMSTIKGGYVPLEMKTEGTLTLEGFVRAMGGAPDQLALPPEEKEIS